MGNDNYNSCTSNTVSHTVVADTAPGAPTDVSAGPGDTQATVNFSTPDSDGGSVILDYTATCGAQSATGASPLVVTGLANGAAVECSVVARNEVGTGPPSASVTVTPFAGPGAPTNLVASPLGSGIASVRFDPPASSGTGPISGYEATCFQEGDAGFSSSQFGTQAPIVVTGLPNGASVRCMVRARNAFGYGPNSSLVEFVVGVPRGPSSVTAVSGPSRGQISMNWSAAEPNGAPITAYTARCEPAASNPGLPSNQITTGPGKRSVVVGGGVPGKSYHCSVFASNVHGPGGRTAAIPLVVKAKA